MKPARTLSIAAFGAVLFTVAVAHAGPPVAITVKNQNTTTAATYSTVGPNETSTYANATPKPPTPVAANSTAAPFSVQSNISPNANYAQVRYSVGSKTCVFYTAFTDTTSSGGSVQWSKTATPSGGAVCTATITGINAVTHAWSVEFTIK